MLIHLRNCFLNNYKLSYLYIYFFFNGSFYIIYFQNFMQIIRLEKAINLFHLIINYATQITLNIFFLSFFIKLIHLIYFLL